MSMTERKHITDVLHSEGNPDSPNTDKGAYCDKSSGNPKRSRPVQRAIETRVHGCFYLKGFRNLSWLNTSSGHGGSGTQTRDW